MEKILDSGARLVVTRADFEVCDRLLIAVSQELKEVSIDIGLKSGSLEDFLSGNVDKDAALNTLKNAVLQLTSSTRIRPVLWECMERCIYVDKKITRNTFNDDKTIGDYLEVAKEVLVQNLLPFFPKASSKFSMLAKAIT